MTPEKGYHITLYLQHFWNIFMKLTQDKNGRLFQKNLEIIYGTKDGKKERKILNFESLEEKQNNGLEIELYKERQMKMYSQNKVS